MTAHVARLLQPAKHGRPLPARLVDHRLHPFWQYAWDVFPEAAAGQVSNRVHFHFLDQFQYRFDVNLGRLEQMVCQRFACQISGGGVGFAHFQDLAHQRITVGMRA
ncbi:hypothetical protein D3C76_1601560 [compost metagenome]